MVSGLIFEPQSTESWEHCRVWPSGAKVSLQGHWACPSACTRWPCGDNSRHRWRAVTSDLGQCCVCLLISSTPGQMGKKRLEEVYAAVEEMRSWKRWFPFPVPGSGPDHHALGQGPGLHHPSQDSSMAPPVLPQTLEPPRRESRTVAT